MVTIFGMLCACLQEERAELTKGTPDFVDETLIKTTQDRVNAESILTVTKALRNIYKDKMVVEEVNAAIATGYYEDETVLLKDLLDPENSPIYQHPEFLERQAKRGFKIGAFKSSFEKVLGVKSDPNLRTSDLYFEDNGLSIYFPYHEDTQYYYPVTVVAATVEADQAWAYSPYTPDPGSIDPATLDTYAILVDDNYASIYSTHIVGMGAEISNATSGTANCNNLKVEIGYIRVKDGYQYDRLFSLSQNGGGADMTYIIGAPTSWQSDLQQVKVKDIGRREARNGDWVAVWGTYTENWQPSWNTLLFGIYEWDNTHLRRAFDDDLQATIGVSIATVPYYLEVPTKEDEVVNDNTYSRSNFISLVSTYGHTPSYQQGFGPKFNSTDGHCEFSLPISCF